MLSLITREPKPGEQLATTFVKHPFIWSGLGLVVRYHDDYSAAGTFWKSVGVLSLAVGSMHSLYQHSND